MNSEGNLIYIDWIGYINIFLKDIKISICFVERMNFNWVICCLYWFLLIGDILVGMCKYKVIGKVV